MEIFLQENENNLHVLSHYKEFVEMLVHLAEVFDRLYKMHLFLQGIDVTVSDVKGKLIGLCARMGVGQARIKAGSTASFSFLDENLKINKIELPVTSKLTLLDIVKSFLLNFNFISTTYR